MKIAHRTIDNDAVDDVGGRKRLAGPHACQAGKPDVRLVIALALGLLISLGASPPIPGMGAGGMSKAGTGLSQGIPTQSFFSHQAAMYDGDYKDALEAFRMDLAGGIKTSQSRWIDSICYYTAMGECSYRMGRLGDALDNYNAALKLYLAFPNWMQQVQFAAVTARPNRQNIPWGHSARAAKLGSVPTSMLIAQGNLYIDQQLQQGGIISQPQLTPINVYEIVRATALAIKRRGEIMGIVCPQDKLTEDIAMTLGRHPGPAHHWSEAWVDLELGLAYVAAGQTGQAIPRLKASLVLDGQFDHPLTALGLLALGQIALDAGDFDSASSYFEEASYSAVEYNDLTTLEEAFRYGQQAHLMSNRGGAFKPLSAAIGWARNRDRELWVSLLLLSAENNALLSQSPGAAAALSEAKTAAGTRAMIKMGEIASRFHYLAALVNFQGGKVAAGEQEIDQSINLQHDASKWLFQIKLADFFVEGQTGPHLGSHRALKLYETLLRDPTPTDWASRPMETLAVLSTPHSNIYEHWFENTLDSGMELGLEVADRTRRHRFFSTLPLGGRLLSLRWVLEAPSDALDKRSQLQRQNLLAHYPKYEDLANQVRKLRADLAAAPLVAETAAAARKQSDALAEIARLSASQEVILREMALRREASDMVFPPMYNTKDVQASLAPRQLMLIFFSTASSSHAWLISKERYAGWKIDSPQVLEKRVATLLRAMGNFDSTRELQQNQLGDDAWRQAARDVTEILTANAKSSGTKINLSANIDELIVVPDGVLWYLPFEALQVPATAAAANNKSRDGKDLVPLITKTRIRYLPTMGLAMPERLNHNASEQVGVVIGRLHPRDDGDLARTQFDQLHKVLPHAAAITSPLPAASPVYGSLFDSLVVFDDIAVGKKGAYEWSPLQLDRSEAAGALAQWFTLPWKSPLQMILPGFHTPAETSLRNAASGLAGNEMFLSVCGLMSTGTRTVLISRWRVGGQSSYELVRQFLQELPFASAADAWQRSVQLAMETPIDFDHESRVKKTANGDAMTAHHPFFWSGYMLVDTGWAPQKAEKKPAAAPVINLNAKAMPPMPAAVQKN
jgi:tetratricopeptide (TPR) repeat protein